MVDNIYTQYYNYLYKLYRGDSVKRIKNAAAVLCSFILSSCAANVQQESMITETTAASSEISIVSAETAEISSVTETVSEIFSETAAETSAEVETEEASEFYEPDRSFVYDSAYSREYESYINRPMFVGEPENTGAEVYVMFTDEEWEYYDAFWEDTLKSNNSILIRHDGITDIIPAVWIERFGEAFKLYSGDYDGDGETEIAAVRYDTGGTMCYVSYLTIFDKVDGHYKSYVFDQYGFISDNFSANVDMNTEKITFKVTGNSDYIYDTAGLFESKAEDISLGSLVDYNVDSDNISVTYGIYIHLTDSALPEILNMNLNVSFKDGEFVLSDAEYTEME